MRHVMGRLAGAVILLVAAQAATPIGQTVTGTRTALPAGACSTLVGVTIPASAIGLPTSGALVTTAESVTATEKDNVNGDFCKVIGRIAPAHAGSPDIEFEVNLPATWNGRALQMGGGGYDGTLVTGLGAYALQPPNTDTPLSQGFVTLGSDGGHQGKPGFDGRFGMDDEALLNYGKQSVKKAHDAALAVVRRAYGRGPAHVYFVGGSQGGHEALDAAARYPQDYDGVVAHYPAYNVTMLHLGSLNVGKAIYAAGGQAWMNPTKVTLIGDAVYAACDGLDGVKDGIISHVAACNATFDVKVLRCPGGTDRGDTCLSDAQLGAVAAIASDYTPGFAVAGSDIFPRWPLLEGALFQGRSNFGTGPRPSNPLSGNEALLYSAGDQTAKFLITRKPELDTMTFDPQQYRARVEAVGRITDVTDVSLEPFRAKGGRIIMTHGTADDFITPHNSIAYYKRQVAQFGHARLDTFLKFYVIPGLGHGFGVFNAKFDSLSALQQWVEHGQAPAGLTALDANEGANAGRTRPLCEYPMWPKFIGVVGSENKASSFVCTMN